MQQPPLHIIGILNVTPDSYVDGGQYMTLDDAARHAGALLQVGADWVEVGGESTGPGSADVPLQEELDRVIPVLEMIRQEYPDARIAVDTYKAEVARRAIAAGAGLINDVTAGRADPEMLGVMAEGGVLGCLMYAKDATPRTTAEPQQYANVIEEIAGFLTERAEAARAAGMSADRIILDPGLGHFVSGDPRYSFQVLAQLKKIAALGYPVLVSPSRKSFLAGAENLPTKDRLPGTIAASAIAVIHGASYIRTHDVASVRRGCEIASNVAGEMGV